MIVKLIIDILNLYGMENELVSDDIEMMRTLFERMFLPYTNNVKLCEKVD
jgi:hypothetical protein